MHWQIHRFETLDTTMREAADRAERGAPEGTVIVAAEQTAGRGRLGRSWVSERGAGVYCSLILRPNLAAAEAPVVTLALGLASGRALQRVCGVACDLRWPNDVLMGGRKCCGILTEMTAAGDGVRHLIAGIGVNVNQAEFPPELADIATSLRIETGCEYVVDAVLDRILEQVDRYLRILVERGVRDIVELFTRASSYAKGKRVVVVGAAEMAGVTAGLTPAGMLLLRQDDGTVTPVLAGSVRSRA
jgi:BirA family biotin operon repressor/biotin-[acetyl-CoA-carboxylase] ligase